MTLEEFKLSFGKDIPSGLNHYLVALWHDKKGNWDKAHQISQDIHDSMGYWIHAYLHRKEGDLSNADYWYKKAGKNAPDYSVDEEWMNLVMYFIEKDNN